VTSIALVPDLTEYFPTIFLSLKPEFSLMRTLVAVIVLLATCTTPGAAQWDRAREQIPNLDALPDRTAELQQKINEQRGSLLLVESVYRITKTLEVDLAKHGAMAIKAIGGTTIVMDGPGPAIRLTGTHQGTASPKSFQPATWNERMPILTGFEILGAHPEASGVQLFQTVGAIVERVSVRWCVHGVHLVGRNRNVVVSNTHLYENSGVGLYLDDVNLHQINVSNSHISYNRAGGVVVRDGNVRNLQVTGCDIEGNMPDDETPTTAANILIDLTGSVDDKSKSVAEIAITGCTIQHSANYSGAEDKTAAPGGANIRLAGKEIYDIDSVTITGNVISDTTTNIDIAYAHDVTISSNTFFAPRPNNLVVSKSQRVVVSGNTFNPRQFERPGTIRFTDCDDCILASSTIHQFDTASGAIILDHCSGFSLNGLVLTDCGSGIVLQRTSNTTIANCRVSRTEVGGADIAIDSSNEKIQLIGNGFSGEVRVDPQAIVKP
jgi:parallel beta-helix repeat protein